jgi:hypothetical protein
VLSNNDFSFQAGSQGGAALAIELIGPHVRFGGTVKLGSYGRLSDLLNFHDQTLTLADAVVLNRTGLATADGVPALQVQIDAICLVLDHSGYVPPPASDDIAVQKARYRLMAVTEAHLITGTFFIYPGVEAKAYLLAAEPRWIPLTEVRVRSVIDRRIKFGAEFAVLNRRSVGAVSVL